MKVIGWGGWERLEREDEIGESEFRLEDGVLMLEGELGLEG